MGIRLFAIAVCVALAAAMMHPAYVANASPGTIERVSLRSNGVEGNDESLFPSISADGRFVSFYSVATNLVRRDTNNTADIFRHDREQNTTIRINVSSSEKQVGNADSETVLSSISGNGALVAFDSEATGLSRKDSKDDDGMDVFLRNVPAGVTLLMNVSSAGKHSPSRPTTEPSISDNGKRVAFISDGIGSVTEGLQVFVRDRATNRTKVASIRTGGRLSNDYNYDVSISSDGRFVTFASDATNLVGGDTNGVRDVFIHDLASHKTERVNVSSDGIQTQGHPDDPFLHYSSAPDASAGGRYVVFDSGAPNLVADDTNDEDDVFLRDRETNTTERISVAADGSQADGGSFRPTISNDGRFIAFSSTATNLVAGDTNDATDVFVYDRVSGTIIRASETDDGTQGDRPSVSPHISGNGEWLAFYSEATNLIPDDTNGKTDVFVKHLTSG